MNDYREELYQIEDEVSSRSISAENPHGEIGCGGMAEVPEEEKAVHPSRDLGVGWKVNPNIKIPVGKETEICNISGEGIIKHIWIVYPGQTYRSIIIRMYWDGCDVPSVECPLGDFFFLGWDKYFRINSAKVCVNPARGLNCFWEMPFRTNCRITIENRGLTDNVLYYQIDYQLRKLPEKTGYFHVFFNRTNPLPYKQDYRLLSIEGKGKYVGTYMAYAPKDNGWWGEGEFKFYIDKDDRFPTICGTGTEDYFLAAYNFEDWNVKKYSEHTGYYSGFYDVKSDGLYDCMPRFGMYRLHITDPVYFEKKITVEVQSIGWREGGRYHPQRDDIASVSFLYLASPIKIRPILGTVEELEIVKHPV